jgi:hypothetical protein
MAYDKNGFLSWGTLKEVIGFLGIVGSMVFVGLQIRSNTIATRATAYQQMGSSLAEVWLSTGQDPEHAALTMRFFEDSSAQFTPTEEAVLVNQSVAAFRLYETTWREVQLGLIKPDVMTTFGWDSKANPAFQRNMSRLWPRMAPMMSPGF